MILFSQLNGFEKKILPLFFLKRMICLSITVRRAVRRVFSFLTAL
jgi:hypothetical protein